LLELGQTNLMRRTLFVFLILCFSLEATAALGPPYKKSPWLAGALAEVFPGAGYFYLEDYKSAFLSSTLMVPIAARYYVTTPTFEGKAVKNYLYYAARNTFGFTVFDTYQSALTPEDRSSLRVNHPHYTFSELMLAPLTPSSYASWKVWVPIGLASFSTVPRLLTRGISPNLTWTRALIAIPLIFLDGAFIGMGEETEFRGFQHTAFSELTRSKWIGNVIQSFSFGLCHTKWGVCTTPYLTAQAFRYTSTIDPTREYVATPSDSDGGDTPDLTYLLASSLYGFYFGWLSSSEDRGLLRAITSHALYDIILITGDLLTTANTGRIYLNVSLPF
jgi:hypothetical protein